MCVQNYHLMMLVFCWFRFWQQQQQQQTVADKARARSLLLIASCFQRQSSVIDPTSNCCCCCCCSCLARANHLCLVLTSVRFFSCWPQTLVFACTKKQLKQSSNQRQQLAVELLKCACCGSASKRIQFASIRSSSAAFGD